MQLPVTSRAKYYKQNAATGLNLILGKPSLEPKPKPVVYKDKDVQGGDVEQGFSLQLPKIYSKLEPRFIPASKSQ